jgi:hypothetical protein
MDLQSDSCPTPQATVVNLPPPPRYEEVPGTVPLHTGRNSGPPPSYEDVINPDGESCTQCYPTLCQIPARVSHSK